jgi:hypothetical protein
VVVGSYPVLSMNWLRVFGNAEASRMGQGVGQQGFDHGVGHSLLLLYDAKAPHGQKRIEFKGLGHDPSNTSISLF